MTDTCIESHRWKLVNQVESGIKGEARRNGQAVVYYDVVSKYQCNDCGTIGKDQYKSAQLPPPPPALLFQYRKLMDELDSAVELSDQEAANAPFGDINDSTFLLWRQTRHELGFTIQNGIVYLILTLLIVFLLMRSTGIFINLVAWGWILLSVLIGFRMIPEFVKRLRSVDKLAEDIDGDRATYQGMLTTGTIIQFFWVIFPLLMAFWVYNNL